MAADRRTRDVALTHELEHADLTSAFFVTRVVEDGRRERRSDSWTTTAQTLDEVGVPVQRSAGHGAEAVVVETDGVLVYVTVANGWVNARAPGDDAEQLHAALAQLRRARSPLPTRTRRTRLRWSSGRTARTARSRRRAQPTYLDAAPAAWTSHGDETGVSMARLKSGFDADGGSERADKAWRLLVLEDTGELLTPDAKSIIGQGLSRFLNVVDGLIGQGLRVLVLVTTNEEIRTLHPAVARPGRAAANVEFTALDEDEASAWLERHGSSRRVSAATLLADLYAATEGFDTAPAGRATGFADPAGLSGP
jgi:hypothetical protein